MPATMQPSYPWRFLFTDIKTFEGALGDPPHPSVGGLTTTWCSGLLTQRAVTMVLNEPTQITAAVWPDDVRVNAIFTDGDPNVAISNRIIYGFRREGPDNPEGTPPWVCRAAGLVMNLEDQGSTEVPQSHLVAYDAWHYLFARPVYGPNTDHTLSFIDVDPGYQFFSTPGNEIALTVLRDSIEMDGFCFVDAGETWNGTSFYSGTIETTPDVNMVLTQGATVGDTWRTLCDMGNMDIVLTPIYDPTNRPGYTHELNIYALAGEDKPSAIFAWDKLMRSVNDIDRMHDATPGAFANVARYHVGEGGPPLIPSPQNNATIRKYLPYWSSQFSPAENDVIFPDEVAAYARRDLKLMKQGKRTVTMSVTPERSPVPFRDYVVGDRVPVLTSRGLRVKSTGGPGAYQRVLSIPITINDEGIESVTSLLVSPDFRELEDDA